MTAVLVAGMLPAGYGTTLAQTEQDACLAETEPNDTPEEAISTSGSVCITGELPDGDQDLFIWEIPEQAAATRWTFGVEGIPGTLTGLKVFRVLSAPGEEPVAVEGSPWLDIGSGPSGPAEGQLADVLLPVGRYLLGISRSDRPDGTVPTSLAYSFRAEPGMPWPRSADVEPNDEDATASTVSDAFEAGGDMAGSTDHFAWTVGQAGLRWDVSVRTALGQAAWLELFDDQGTILARGSAETSVTLYDLALAPGRYLIRAGPATDGERPYILRAALSGLEADPEPNDEAAAAVPLLDGQAIRGRLASAGDRDRYRLVVPAGDQRLRDVRLVSRSGPERSVCLIGEDGSDVVCRAGEGGASIPNLLLAPGPHLLEVRGWSDPSAVYLLRVDTTGEAVADFETEPNDTPALATPFDPGLGMRGRATRLEDDHFVLITEGEAQLWQVEARGTGVEALVWEGSDGRELGVADNDPGTGKARLTDMYLVPGRHWLRLRGSDAEYVLEATPLGPPDPDSELEPNSDPVRAEAYRIGQRRVGRLPGMADADYFRFTVAAPERVRLRLSQPPGARIGLRLSNGEEDLGDIRDHAAGAIVTWDLSLLPGDHLLMLWSLEPGDGRYELTSERLDPFEMTADQEPNDAAGFARDVPAQLSWQGTALYRGDRDWYRLPPLERPSRLRLHLEGGDARARLEDVAGDRIDLEQQDDGSLLSEEVAAGTTAYLIITSSGDHSVSLQADGLAPAPVAAALPVTLAARADQTQVAAYWPEAQVVAASLEVRNEGSQATEVLLDARTSHYLWSVTGLPEALSLAAGEARSLPLVVRIAPDAWAGEDVRISLRARTVDGGQATGALVMSAAGDAAPVGSEAAWSVPEPLLGGLNVAWLGLGAVPDSRLDPERGRMLFDGVAPSGGGFGQGLDALPVELEVDLAGDDPLPIIGTIIDPQARDGRLDEMPRSFELLLSADGESWTTVLRAELSTLPVEQAFVLAEAVPARYARLRILDMHGDRSSYLAIGEWKVIAAPGVVPSPEPFDIAAIGRGGHVVVMEPFDTLDTQKRLLDEDPRPETLWTSASGAFSMVIGFRDERAAQIGRLEWQDPDGSQASRRLTEVQVSVSADSPLGPWQPLGTWVLTRHPDGGVAPFDLVEPVWARYVRLAGTAPPESSTTEAPGRIRVIERATDDEYRSILGEWGDTWNGPREWLSPPAGIQVDEGADAGDDLASATPLVLGDSVTDRAAFEVDEDWYRFSVPAGHNTLEVTLRGYPSVGVRLALVSATGVPQPMALELAEDGAVRYEAAVEPGNEYVLRVDQPPFSAIFAFDTSGSMGPFLDFVLEGVRSFAKDVEPGREAVMFLPFEEDPVPDDWEDDPFVLQAAVSAWSMSTGGSSSAEQAIIDSTQLLALREGSRAILLVTDADTTSSELTPELWEDLDAVRPVIFAVHVGGSNDPVLRRQLMQAWAASAGGHYTYPTTHGEMTRAFERMATQLRRPAIYSLLASTSEVIAQPGSLRVSAPADGSRAAMAPDVGVEIILDTSGSMLEKLAGRRRIDIAREALESLVGEVLPEGLPVAMRTFGGSGPGKAARCETRLTLPLEPLDRASVLKLIGGLKARKKTGTPLGAALQAVAGDLTAVTGPRVVVLVTDGAETCGGEPAATIVELRESGLQLNVNIVGFALDDEGLKATMAGWAAQGGGTYFDAAGPEALAAAIRTAVNAPFRVYGPAGDVVADGTVDGAAVPLDPGIYRAEVLTAPPVVFAEVVVGGGEAVALVLPGADQEP